MIETEAYTLEVKGLEQLLKALKGKQPIARVGILGTSSSRNAGEGKKSKGPLNNAEIGALYEYNDGSRPGGSFLRVPISDNLDKELEKSGALGKPEMREVIRSGSVLPWLTKVAILAEGIVLEAFATSGFGKWKQSNMTRKKNHQTLVETHQLRDSITHEVKEG